MAVLKALVLASVAAVSAERFLATVKPLNASAAIAHKHNLTSDEQLQKLQVGLETISKLQSVFTAGGSQDAMSASEMASGAMTSELSNKDSMIWKTIAAMMDASKHVEAKMKGASNADRAKIMTNLEDELDTKAEALSNITAKATKVNEEHSAQYLLGLLNLHHKDWSIEKQLNTTLKFANSSMAAWQLAHHHSMTRPFAAQLAEIMDSEEKSLTNTTGKAKNAVANTKNARKAAKLFIQLVGSLHRTKTHKVDPCVIYSYSTCAGDACCGWDGSECVSAPC